jgi:hypothetical protein
VSEWFASGIAIDLILVAIGLECAFLMWLGRLRGTGLPSWLPNLASGAALLIALRLALVDAHWSWISAALVFALLAHVFDLLHRFEPGR